jgi:hypothetical protein
MDGYNWAGEVDEELQEVAFDELLLLGLKGLHFW